METPLLGLSVPGSLVFCTLPAVGLHISSHFQRKCFNPLNLASRGLLMWKMPLFLFVLFTRVQTDWIFLLAFDMSWGKGWYPTDFCLGSLCTHNCAPHLKADRSKMIVLQAWRCEVVPSTHVKKLWRSLASWPSLMSESQVPEFSPPVLGSQCTDHHNRCCQQSANLFYSESKIDRQLV